MQSLGWFTIGNHRSTYGLLIRSPHFGNNLQDKNIRTEKNISNCSFRCPKTQTSKKCLAFNNQPKWTVFVNSTKNSEIKQNKVLFFEEISFGGIPNSSSIILLPRLTTWAPFFLRSGSAHVDNVITKRCSKQSHGCPWQGCKATNHTVTLRNLPNPASGTYTSAHRNSPEPASGTYNSTHRNSPEPSGTYLPNLHQHTSELSGTFRNLPPELAKGTRRNSPEPATFRNLPPEPTPAHTGTLRNLQPSGTCLRNLHQHTPELSGTFRNLSPEPAPATHRNSPERSGTCNLPELASGTYTSKHRNSPEPSGTCLRNLHQQHTGTLRNLLLRPAPATHRNSPEPAPATRTGTHRSLSGLKTPF